MSIEKVQKNYKVIFFIIINIIIAYKTYDTLWFMVGYNI